MAPSDGHILVPKVINAFKYAVIKTTQAVRSRLPQSQQQAINTFSQPIAISIRNVGSHQQPIHPLAFLRRSRTGQVRGFATSIRAALAETYPSLRSAARSIPSRTTTLARAPSAATFGSVLRPRLTGGALPRTAGGYVGLGGRRAFSHVPSAQQQVLANVSAGVRAFWLGGQRAQFDGIDKRTGEKRFVAVGKESERAMRKMLDGKLARDARGTSIEFCVIPELHSLKGGVKARKSRSKGGNKSVSKSEDGAITELTSAVTPLATDFARNLGMMAAVHRDLKLLSQLGDLPISETRPGWIAVRFPGCDGRSVERLCDELGVSRGIVREDEAWAEEQAQDVKMALLFPTAPSEDEEDDAAAYFFDPPPAVHSSSPEFVMPESLRDHRSDGEFTADETLSPLESLHGSVSDRHDYEHLSRPASSFSWQPNPWIEDRNDGVDQERSSSLRNRDSRSFQGVSTASQEMENIYMFIAECDGRLGARAHVAR